MKCCAVAALCFVLTASGPAFGAQAESEVKLPEKTLTAALGKDLLLAARGAARLGIKYLKARQDKDENRVWFPPQDSVTRIPVGWKTVQVTHPVYKTVKKVVPVQKHVGYKWVWVEEKDPKNPYAPVGRKRIQRPVYKYVNQLQEVQVRDGNKTRVVEEKRRVYQESDPCKIYARWLEGVNALALYTLLCSGEPIDSPYVAKPAEWLYDGTLEQHGIPDTTYELSLFVMAFCRLDKETYGKFVEQMLEKLVAGQIQAGSCRGQWGIYSVDVERLKKLQIIEMKGVILRDKLLKDIAHDKHLLPAARSKREKGRLTAKIERNQKVHDQVMEELKKVREKIIGLTREFTRGSQWGRVRRSERIGGDLRFYPGAFYDIRYTRRGDLPNTHLALLALRDASHQGFLKPGSPLAKELAPALARAANALKKLQQPDGSWGYGMQEHHTRQPTPVKPSAYAGKPQEKPNEPCVSMTAVGVSCLDCIAELAGRARARRSFGDTIDKARAAALKHLYAYSKRGLEPELPMCAQYGVLYYYFALATMLNDPTMDRTRFGLIPEGIVCRILFAQENDGSWPRLPVWSFGSSTYMRSLMYRNWIYNTYETRFGHQLVNTCFAVLFLCEAGRPTLGGQWNWSGQRNIRLDEELEEARDALAKECKAPLRWRSISAELPDGLAAFVPVLVIGGNAASKNTLAASREKLGKYLDQGGLLVAHCPPGTSGQDLKDRAKRQLRQLYTDVAFRPLPASHAAFNYAVPLQNLPEIEAAWKGEQLLAVLLAERTPGTRGLSQGDISRVIRNLMGERSATKKLEPDFVVGPENWKEVEKDVEAALARVKEQHIKVPEALDPTAPKKEPEKGPKKEPVQPKKPDKPVTKEPPKEKTPEDELKELRELNPEPEPKDKRKRPKDDEKF